MVLAGFQGSGDRPAQFVCAALRSKPRKHQQKAASSQTALSMYVETPRVREKGSPDPSALSSSLRSGAPTQAASMLPAGEGLVQGSQTIDPGLPGDRAPPGTLGPDRANRS